MNPFQFPVTCDVCGQGGMGTIDCAAAAWDTRSTVRHTDPQVCADYLARKKRDLDKREATLNERDGAPA